MSKTIDMIGFRSGRLTVISRDGSKYGQSTWRCKCDCGNEFVACGGNLRRGNNRSCGCLFSETRTEIAHRSIAKIKHGDSFARLYFVWNDIKSRCNNPKDISYKHYGGRGIKVCDEWKDDYMCFKKWAYENGYDESAARGECTIDRIDHDGDYEPANCRWVNNIIQSNNKRNTPFITYNGETKSLTDWAREFGLSRSMLYKRYKKNCPVEKLFEPSSRLQKT